MRRVANGTQAASLPTRAAPVGTPGFFTGGTPGTTEATEVDEDCMNLVQEELIAVIVGAGLALDNSGANAGQLLQAIPGVSMAHGQCRLAYASATSLSLKPFNGNVLRINGIGYQIPSAGVSLSNSGLSASTLYYVYASISGGNMVLTASTTGHSTDTSAANYGVEIMTGNSAYTLVGMAYTSSASQFVSTLLACQVASWFNRQTRALSSGTVNFGISGTSSVTGTQLYVLVWADDAISFRGVGFFSTSSGTGCTLFIYLDGGAAGIAGESTAASASNYYTFGASVIDQALSEGLHGLVLVGGLTGGSTAILSVGISGTYRS